MNAWVSALPWATTTEAPGGRSSGTDHAAAVAAVSPSGSLMVVCTSGARRTTGLSSTARSTAGSPTATCAARCPPAELPDTVTRPGRQWAIAAAVAARHCSIIVPIVAAGARV